jgi:hypothetical protein
VTTDIDTGIAIVIDTDFLPDVVALLVADIDAVPECDSVEVPDAVVW